MFLQISLLLCAVSVWCIPSFTSGPDYTVLNNKVRITFTVSENTDVDVSVINPVTGKVVRHLAAGLLGGTFDPPEPLVKGFAQSIEWDGLDDHGVWVGNQSMDISVRMNVRPVLKHTMRFLKGNEMRYLNTKLIARSPLYFPDTGKFIDLNCYKFYNSYGDMTLLPTVIGMDMSVNDETDEIMLKTDKGAYIAPCGVSWWYAKMAVYDGLTGSLTPKRQINLKPNSGPLAKDSVAVYGPDLSLGEFYYSWDGRYIFYDEPGPWKGSWRFDAKTGLAA
ncbi:MAG: hypothetical protein JNL74_09030, partial [Fibrobacteres bacterium]|nr:hypothetical protein [Fibrobacterota bacterium]